jgi:modification methylase
MKELMKTTHRIILTDSREMKEIPDGSVDLAVTSPPYPMIEMWDDLFSSLSAEAAGFLEKDDGTRAFEAMHFELDKVWRELHRVLRTGAFACINIGDATRTIGGRFCLYSNHSRIINAFRTCGFDCLPVVLWRKQTNAPNKFMGSGMLPAGAYVTLEHEYILLFRKGGKRQFTTDAEKSWRMRSAYFWEERNRWFSDVWDFKGTVQGLDHGALRSRSAAFPLELPYRLINMYSLYEDTVLDPFLGTGTTTLASIACGRNSIGVEIEGAFSTFVVEQARSSLGAANRLLSARVADHDQFVASQAATKGPVKYVNIPHGFPVVTRQEMGMELYRIADITTADISLIEASYEPVGRLDDAAKIEKETRAICNIGSGQLTLDL